MTTMMYPYETTRNAASSSFSTHAAVLLKERHNDPQIANNNCQVLTDCSNFDDIRRIKELVHSSLPICRIDKVNQVNQRHMYGMYSLRKEEMQLKYHNSMVQVQELSLFHVTTEERGLQSLESGLDWRRTKRSRFGSGVSFSDDADYADFYANFKNPNREDKRVIIVCAVLVAQTIMTKPNYGYTLKIPPKMYDTTMSPNGRVYVKYDDYEFYPLYLVYYQRRPEDICKSRYFQYNKHLKQLTAEEQQKVEEQEELKRQELMQTIFNMFNNLNLSTE